MEESKVTVDGVTYGTGRPFMVIATQNPIEQTGTYKLPEAQLDRFLMKTSLGYPDHDSVITILTGSAQRDRTASLRPVISGEDITVLSDIAAHVYLNPAIADYVARLGAATRNDPETRIGVSVRGCIALVRAAKVWQLPRDVTMLSPMTSKNLRQKSSPTASSWTRRQSSRG